MTEPSEVSGRVAAMIAKGEEVLATHRPNPPGVIGFPTLESGAFAEWRAQVTAFLVSVLGKDHPYTTSFVEKVEQGYTGSTKAGIGILRAVKEDVDAGLLGSSGAGKHSDPLSRLTRLCERFHLVARQLRSRHGDRATLDVTDEYDVQDLLHALLRIDFEDVRAEEATPSYAGKSSRMDFILKAERIGVECKHSRTGLDAKHLGSQLIEDIERYKTHPDFRTLVCFVYDPEGRIANPRGIEADLSDLSSEYPVAVLIRP